MPSPDPSARQRGFPPVADARTRVLVLGSLPGVQSLARGQYYGNPRNQFWRLVGALVGEDLHGLPYDERLARLLAHRFGLWDVLASGERAGSLDSAIRKPAANDFALLREWCPELRTVGFNGQASARFAPQFAQAGYRTVVLPSSSPAHMTLSFEQKLQLWRGLLREPEADG